MIFVALTEAADRGQLLLVEGGLLRFHRRRDGVTVIRELLVLPAHRRRGVGRRLVGEVVASAPGPVECKCPQEYEANLFWESVGFRLVEVVGRLNRYRREPGCG